MQANQAPVPSMPFAEPTPLGLFGLAIGCGALLPIAFGVTMSPEALRTASMFCLLFGAGGQQLAGLMSLANKNTLGGTLFTTFSFNWVMNWWALSGLAEGKVPDAKVVLAVDVTFLVIFVVLTYAFGFFSKLLFVFLLDIDLLYVLRIAKHFLPGAAGALGMGVGFATIALALIAMYIALAMLLNPAAGRPLLPIAGPLFKAGPTP